MKNNVVIGKIFNVHGIKGELKVRPLTDDINRFKILKRCFIKNKEYEVSAARINKDQIILKLKGLDDRNEAEILKNEYVEVLREDSVGLEEGEYFIEDLKGLKVLDEDDNEIGIMSDVLTNAAIDIYVFKIEGKEQMLPALKENILEINIDEYIKINSKNLVY
ncbi:ribosome maturation factor RimM [Anaerofustis stercorihominis]|uniref:Ribosome maturation factor RimM n=2 Tax=Anaerofustis stercorihominis TaxID=214853 RepID=B1CC26_9FIRM|nr:ribosome maturation factor RimM [Anaerofustis stercorihominis]EDS71823.1 16S rRNA processing protein RimM [Anaerofustis stercorihominis DSM 17244]MCQ4796123.1 ribosome maturation factor RimM [Anaerofustis stercorihominis]RGD75099.1 16S rRNA processing protein RimM [Anaerofustis stercorihominis]